MGTSAGGLFWISTASKAFTASMADTGIALPSSWFMAEYQQSSRLVAIALDDAQPKELAVFPPRRQVLSKLRVFVEDIW